MTTDDQNQQTETPPAGSGLPVTSGSRRKGKVARLPKRVRDQINNMLLDGLTYLQIIENLGDAGSHLTDQSLSTWKEGGYQDWLREQERVDLMRHKQDFALDLLTENDGSKIHQASLQVSAANLVQLMVDLDPTILREALEKDPDKYTRVLNAIARLSEGEIKCERHQNQEAERLAKIAKDKAVAAKKGGISDEAFEKAEEKLKLM